MARYMSKKAAKEIIENYKDSTNYFNGVLTYGKMFEMLRNDCRFGVAETNVILASLIACGAIFTK